MRYGTDSTAFDLTDADHTQTLDRVDDVLDIAGEVVLENAPDPGNTRIERLARWVVANLCPDRPGRHAGAISVFSTGHVSVVRLGEKIFFDPRGGRTDYSSIEAREVATALYRAAETVDLD